MENSISTNIVPNVHIMVNHPYTALPLIDKLKEIYSIADEPTKEAIRSSLLTWLNEEKTKAIFNKTMGR